MRSFVPILLVCATCTSERTDGDIAPAPLELDTEEYNFLRTQLAVAQAEYTRLRAGNPAASTVFSPVSLALSRAKPELAEKLSAALNRRTSSATLSVGADGLSLRAATALRFRPLDEGLVSRIGVHAVVRAPSVQGLRVPFSSDDLVLELYEGKSIADAEAAAWNPLPFRDRWSGFVLPRLSLRTQPELVSQAVALDVEWTRAAKRSFLSRMSPHAVRAPFVLAVRKKGLPIPLLVATITR